MVISNKFRKKRSRVIFSETNIFTRYTALVRWVTQGELVINITSLRSNIVMAKSCLLLVSPELAFSHCLPVGLKINPLCVMYLFPLKFVFSATKWIIKIVAFDNENRRTCMMRF